MATRTEIADLIRLLRKHKATVVKMIYPNSASHRTIVNGLFHDSVVRNKFYEVSYDMGCGELMIEQVMSTVSTFKSMYPGVREISIRPYSSGCDDFLEEGMSLVGYLTEDDNRYHDRLARLRLKLFAEGVSDQTISQLQYRITEAMMSSNEEVSDLARNSMIALHKARKVNDIEAINKLLETYP